MPFQGRTPQTFGPVQVAAPRDGARPPRERVRAIRESLQHRVIQRLGRRRPARPGEHLGLCHHDVGIVRIDSAQPGEARQRADQLPVPAVEDRESVQGPLVGRVGCEDALVARAGGGVIPSLKRLVRRRQLRGQGGPDHERESHRQGEVARHQDPHTSRIASYAGFKRSCHVGTSQVGQA